jgi:serine protease Do
MGPQGGRPNEEQNRSIGTGFIISEDGLIVTNSHVVRATDNISVQLIGESKSFPAEIIGDDSRTDVALIKIKADRKLPFADLGNSDTVEVGEWVAAFGNPYGHTFSMTKGIISAKQREITELSPVAFLQTDASINPGNSGGPLVNTKGEVIGVNTAIDARAQGIGFAIPINEIKRIKPQLEKLGYVVRGYLGVGIDNVSIRAQRALRLKDPYGALIMSVEPGSPAEKGGLQDYDVVKKFNGKNLDSANDFVNAVKDSPIDSMATLEVIRNGETKSLKVKVGTPPDQKSVRRQSRATPPQGQADSKGIGLELSPFSQKLANQLKISPKAPQGVVVTKVKEGSAAWRAGLRTSDIILDVNKEKVKTPQEVFAALRSGENILRVYNAQNLSLVFLEVE